MTDASLVTFWLGETEYGFDVADVVEMVAATHVTPVPGMAASIVGVTNWRGKTVPVLDLGALLKVEHRSPDVKKRLLVLKHPGPWSVLVERPGRIVAPGGWEPVDAARPETDRETVRPRLVRTAEGVVQILDAARLLDSGRKRTNGEDRP